MQRCPTCGEENSDRARFCQNCATPLGDTEVSTEVRKVVTIVFADVTGSTSLGERLDPEALRRVMGRYFDEMSAVIERHGGAVEKFIGDAVMAAERGYRQGVELFDRLGETGFNSTMLAGLAMSLCRQGRLDEAEDAARRSEAITAQGDFASEAGWREARALVLSGRGEHDAAIELADAAIDHVRPTDYLEMVGEAHEIRGDVLAASGRRDEARAAYDAALATYERKGIVPRIARTRDRIAKLGR